MTAHTVIDAPRSLDEISVFLPGIPEPERELRNKIRVARMVATQRIPELPLGSQALQLSWMVIDTATAWMLAPADLEMLETVADQCRRLLIVAQNAAELEALS